ncbi:MAG: T9SS type A sorting domain-containing protein [Ignavibacteriota bacterium]
MLVGNSGELMMRRALNVCAVLTVCLGAGIAYGQSHDSCLKFLGSNTGHPEYDSTFINPDSILVDSCIGSPTFLHRFAKQWFTLRFEYGSMLPIPAAPVDSIILVEWRQIDAAYQTTRAGFDTLQQIFGHFILKKGDAWQGDTSVFSDRDFDLRFDSIVDIQAVVTQMLSIPMILDGSVNYLERAGGLSIVGSNPPNKSNLILQPNPAFSKLNINSEGYALREISIIDISGKQVFEKTINGLNEVSLDISGLASGKYIVVCNGMIQKSLVITK